MKTEPPSRSEIAELTQLLLKDDLYEVRTTTQLWECGYDYDDEDGKHKLEKMVHRGSLPRGACDVVRVSWYDEKEDVLHLLLHVHMLDECTPAPPEFVAKYLELKIYRC